MEIPRFINLEYDVEASRAFVTVLDREERKQREMWGMSYPPPKNPPIKISLILRN